MRSRRRVRSWDSAPRRTWRRGLRGPSHGTGVEVSCHQLALQIPRRRGARRPSVGPSTRGRRYGEARAERLQRYRDRGDRAPGRNAELADRDARLHADARSSRVPPGDRRVSRPPPLSLPLNGSSRVLHLRCSWGALSFNLAACARSIVAMDDRPPLLRFVSARKRQNRCDKLHVVAAAPTSKLPFANGAFDAIVLSDALEEAGSADG